MSPSSVARRLPLVAGGPRALAVEHLSGSGAGTPRVLFCGGFHSSMQGHKARAIEAHCARRGLACTRFDYRGHGESDGDAASLTLHDWLEDTLAVIDDATDGATAAPGAGATGGAAAAPARLILVGSSMGAWLAVLAAARRAPKIAALLLVAAAPDFLQDTLPARLRPASRTRLARGECVRLETPDDPDGWPVSPALIDSGRELALLSGEPTVTLRCPVRMLHGTADDTAPWGRAVELLERLGSDDATLTLIGNGDHRLSTPRELRRLSDALDELTTIATAAEELPAS